MDDVQRLFNDMECAKATKDKVKIVLNQIFDSAVEDDYISKNPLKSKKIKITGTASKTTKPYSVDQMRFLTQHISDIKKPLDRMFFALLSMHPLRLEEVLGLQWKDIDFEDKAIHINRAVTHPKRNKPEIKSTKTEASVRFVPLTASAAQYLIPANDDDFVLGGANPLTYTQVRGICKRIQKDIGFNENITPIRFRTTVLTDYYDQTKDIKLVQQLAGHTTSSMTLKYYVKGREDVSKAATAIQSLYNA